MNRKRIVLCALAAGFGLVFGQGCEKKTESGTGGTSPAKTLKFSAIPDQDKKNLEKFNAIASHLTKELGVNVEYVASSDYAASVSAFRNGDIHLAWFGGLTGVQAREFVPGAKAIAQGDTDPAFTAYIIAHKDAGLQPSESFPKQIGDLKFTFGEPQSTSGRLMPQFFMEKETGLTIDEFFKKNGTNFSKGHDATCDLVQAGTFQAGVVNYSVYDKRVKEGKTDPNLVQVIWKTPAFADYNWTAHPDLEKTYGAGFTDKLQKALIGMTATPALLEVFPRKAMITAKNEDYEGIKAVAVKLGFLTN